MIKAIFLEREFFRTNFTIQEGILVEIEKEAEMAVGITTIDHNVNYVENLDTQSRNAIITFIWALLVLIIREMEQAI